MSRFETQPLPIGEADGPTYANVPQSTALEHEFPAAAMSRIGEHESWRKEIHRPATSTHKWWAKRLGSVFRGIITAAVTDSCAEALKAYGSPTKLAGLTIFDPFAGSGTVAVEAMKLGARVVSWDINPVATLVQRQAMQRWDAGELERAYKLVEESCRSEIDRIHRTVRGEPVLYYFWVAIASCPTCRANTRLFSTHVFSQHAYPKRVPNAQVVCPACLDVVSGRYDFEKLMCGNGHSIPRKGAVDRSMMTCQNGHKAKVIDGLNGVPPRYEMYAKLVHGSDGVKRYESIEEYDRELYAECTELLDEKARDLVLPVGNLDDGENTRQAIRWGFARWRQFFNNRQLYSLGLMATAIRDLNTGEPEREALATLFSGVLEFNNMFCSFKGEGTGAVRHMFSHHILKPERTPLEAHPWGTPASSGSFSTLFNSRLLRAHDYKLAPNDLVVQTGAVVRVGGLSRPTEADIVEAWPNGSLASGMAYVRTGDSSNTDIPAGSVDLIVTDPPYMDNVHYSELADFFHAWLGEVQPFSSYPHKPTTRSDREVQSSSPTEFGAAIGSVWTECERVLKPDGLLAFTFHQARLSGWVALMEALAVAGFLVTAIQPVKGEMTTSVSKNGTEPSNLDAVVVCRKRVRTLPASRTQPEFAAAEGARRLTTLIKSGINVGAGDVRSVIRGHVLATFTEAPDVDMGALAARADELSAAYAVQLLMET